MNWSCSRSMENGDRRGFGWNNKHSSRHRVVWIPIALSYVYVPKVKTVQQRRRTKRSKKVSSWRRRAPPEKQIIKTAFASLCDHEIRTITFPRVLVPSLPNPFSINFIILVRRRWDPPQCKQTHDDMKINRILYLLFRRCAFLYRPLHEFLW